MTVRYDIETGKMTFVFYNTEPASDAVVIMDIIFKIFTFFLSEVPAKIPAAAEKSSCPPVKSITYSFESPIVSSYHTSGGALYML